MFLYVATELELPQDPFITPNPPRDIAFAEEVKVPKFNMPAEVTAKDPFTVKEPLRVWVPLVLPRVRLL